MKEILKAIKNVLLTNWPALIGVALLAAILQIQFKFNFILGFILLLVLYFVLGCIIEYILQSYNHYKRTKRGKTAEQLKKEAEIRERRRARGMEMLKDEQDKNLIEKESDYYDERPVRRTVSRVSSVSTESAQDLEESRREIKPASVSTEKREKIRSEFSRRKTPFDVTPPAESVSDETVSENNINDDSADIPKDEVLVDTDIIDSLYENEVNDNIIENTDSSDEDSEDTDVYASAENVKTSEDIMDNVTETVQVENVSDESKDETEIDEPLTIDEMKQTSEDISREIKERVSAPRKRTHVIFDAYQVEKSDSDDNIFDDEEKKTVLTDTFDDFDNESDDIVIDVDDDIPTTDSVNANQDKLDELYEDSSDKSTNKTGFFSKALSGLKKKRNERKNRRNS